MPVTVPVVAKVTVEGTDPPAWISHALTVLVPLVAILLATLDPGGKINTASAQAALILGGLVIGAGIHIVRVVATNGLTKAGLTRTISEEETWIRANGGELRTTFLAAKPALDALPGVPAALSEVTADLELVKAKVALAPPVDVSAVEAVVTRLVPTLVIPQVLAAVAVIPTAPAGVTDITITPPAVVTAAGDTTSP